ncbi:probable RNA helicase armi [Neocloeon triangulifer]|uniref:probable RNA helicase armi n=1 Tax=Neocloeon triangulifer TaxID=2078957 RepID=UPI00286F0004|nr:probable RNA helicase armi [Neocloeon triangulifer]
MRRRLPALMGSVASDLKYKSEKRRLNLRRDLLKGELNRLLRDLQGLGVHTDGPMDDDVVAVFEQKKCSVLQVRSDGVLLSGGIRLDLDPALNLKEGDTVQVVKTHDHNSPWTVTDVNTLELLVGEKTIKSFKSALVSEEEEGQVVSCANSTLILDPGRVTVDLKQIKCSFTPAEGDLVLVTKQEDKVVALSPLASEVFDATVAFTDSFTGLLQRKDGDVVRFSYLACETHYMPRKGDQVCAEAIRCHSEDKVRWRALKMVLLALAVAEPSSNPEVEELLQESNIISTGTHFNCGTIKLGSKGRLMPILANISDESHCLTNIYPYKKVSPNPQFKLVTEINFPKILLPGETFVVSFECHPQEEGSWRDMFVFDFDKGKFQLGRFFAVEVQSGQNSLGDQYKRNGAAGGSKADFAGPLVKSNRKKQDTNPFRRRVQKYILPENIKNIVESLVDSSKDRVLVTLKEKFPFLMEEVDTFNYVQRFTLLLHLEEAEAERGMQRWNLSGSSLEKDQDRDSYSVNVPNLTERRPSILFGDSVHVKNVRGGPVYEGIVEDTLQGKVRFRLNSSFSPISSTELYNVKFLISRSNFKFQHSAVSSAWKTLGDEILFPTEIEPAEEVQVRKEKYPNVMFFPPNDETSSNGDNQTQASMRKRNGGWYNPYLNPSQRAAVTNILTGEARPMPHIIFGPPGTGKTVTVVETILQIYKLVSPCRILVATPSNSAADLVTELLVRAHPTFRPIVLARLVAFSYRKVPAYLQKYSVLLKQDNNIEVDLSLNKITIGTCSAVGRLCLLNKCPYYTHVIIDESGQASEPETMCAVALMGKPRQIVLAGDPKQLGPVIMGRIASQGGLDVSWLSRLLMSPLYSRDMAKFPATQGYDPRLVTMLTRNYRTVPEILNVASRLFYNNQLVPMVSQENGWPAELLKSVANELPSGRGSGPPAFVFHGVKGRCCRDADSPSWYNPVEVNYVLGYVRKLISSNVKPWDIGIITFYAKQTAKVREMLRSFNISDLKVGSVEEFQGQERNVMILSTVRVLAMDDDSMGFISSPRRINVAITRAKALLIIVGDPHLLRNDPNWDSILLDCISRNAYTGCDLPITGNAGQRHNNQARW